MAKRILLKLTGEVFRERDLHQLSPHIINNVIQQIKQLQNDIQFAIVVGGGNFFRGSQQGKIMNVTPNVGHHIGILATLMNGLMLKDLLEQNGVKAVLLSAITCPEIAESISNQAIETALRENTTLVFAGGIGTPFFSTDTTAVVRALQIDAQEIWKASHIDGVYTADPKIDHNAKLLPELSYDYAIKNKLAIMDWSSLAIAYQHKKNIRIFSIFEHQAIINAAYQPDFGSLIHV